jgi:alcohol dehydrogenase (cytochrome c)
MDGDLGGNFFTFDARDGKMLYSFNTGGPIAAGVVTYAPNRKHYVVVASGCSGGFIPLTGSTTIVIFGQ